MLDCSNRENIILAWHVHVPNAPCSLDARIQSSFLLIRMTSSLCYFWCLLALSPSFRPLTDKSHRQQWTEKLYPDRHIEKSTHQQRVGREVMNCAAPQLSTTAICCSCWTVIVSSGSSKLLAYVLQSPLCRDLMDK